MKSYLAMGIIGLVFGVLAALFALVLGSFLSAFGAANTLYINAVVAIVGSAIGFVGGAMGNKVGGALMIVGGIIVLVAVGLFGVLTLILYFVGGILELREKPAPRASVVSSTAGGIPTAPVGIVEPLMLDRAPTGPAIGSAVERSPASIQSSTAESTALRPVPPVNFAPSPEGFCPYCGSINPADYNFCGSCHRRLPIAGVVRSAPQSQPVAPVLPIQQPTAPTEQSPPPPQLTPVTPPSQLLPPPAVRKRSRAWLYILVAGVILLLVVVAIAASLVLPGLSSGGSNQPSAPASRSVTIASNGTDVIIGAAPSDKSSNSYQSVGPIDLTAYPSWTTYGTFNASLPVWAIIMTSAQYSSWEGSFYATSLPSGSYVWETNVNVLSASVNATLSSGMYYLVWDNLDIFYSTMVHVTSAIVATASG
jgi:hypothetical protein